MNEHSTYFQEHFKTGKLLIGLAVLEVGDEAEAREFGENDPSVRAGLNRWEIYPMRVSGFRAQV